MYYPVPNVTALPNNNLPQCNNFGTNTYVPPPPIQSFQQNSSMSYLSGPPPNLATHHVFHNVPSFNNSCNQNVQVLPASSIIINTAVPPPTLVSPVRLSLPDIKPFENHNNSWNTVPSFNSRPFTDNARHSPNFQNPSNDGTNLKNTSFAPPRGMSGSFQNISDHSISGPPGFNGKQWATNTVSGSRDSSRSFHKSGEAGFPSNLEPENHGKSSFRFETPTTFSKTNTSNSDSKYMSKTSNYESRNFNPWNSSVSNYNRPIPNFKRSNDSDFRSSLSNREEPSLSDRAESSNNFQNRGKPGYRFERPTSSNTNTSHFDSKFKNASNYESRNHRPNFNSWNSSVSNYNRAAPNFQSSNDSDFRSNLSNREEPSFSDSGESSKNFQTNQNRREYGMKSWMTEEISSAIEKKRSLFSQAKFSNDPGVWEEFRKQRNHINGLIRNAKFKAGVQDSQSVRRNSESTQAHACDTCDRAFTSESDLHFHISEHIKCDVGDCQFEAHTKIVALHKKMQHDTGYADAISKLKDDKEIQKWREERRRRFPTAANILKRKAEHAEKEERGEVIENKEFGKFKRQKVDGSESQQNNHGRGRNRQQHSRPNRKFENRHRVARPIPAPISDSDSDDDSHIKIPRFLGFLAVPDCDSLQSVENVNADEMSAHSNDELKNSDTMDETQVTPKVSGSSTEVTKSSKEKVSDLCNEKETVVAGEGEVPNLINIDSDDEAPTELPISKSSAIDFSSPCGSDEKSINNINHIGSAMENEISVGLDDEAPLKIPILKAPLVGSSNSDDLHEQNANTRNHSDAVEKSKFPNLHTVVSDDEAPIELAIAKEPPVDSSSPDASKERSINSTNHKNTRSSKNFSKSNGETLNKNQVDKNYNNPVRKSTLLEKLLSDDIRHERNLIMQCVRHVVKNNFFGIEQNGKAS